MGAIEDAIESREPGEIFSCRQMAAIHGCSHSALSRRYRSVLTSRSTKAQNQQALQDMEPCNMYNMDEKGCLLASAYAL